MAIDRIKTIWPEWQIEEKPLGKGSFGVVYKAVRTDHNVQSVAAIKVISIPSNPAEVDSLRSEGLDMNSTRTYIQGIVNDFVSEIQLMESLKGVQNIVSVEDYKVIEKTHEIGWDIYIRMELLTPFNTYSYGKQLTEEEVIRLGCDICSALEICSSRNIIHRDIKPENIFINDFGHFKLGDFGIARKMENMTVFLSQKGTFNYMAPEVANSGNYDARADTYSLGIVLYRLLNGNRLPFLDTEAQILNPNERRNALDRRIRGEELPAPCDASPAMAEIILRACAHDPDMRFASAAEMKQALMGVAIGTYPLTARHPDKTTPVRNTPVPANRKADQVVNTFGAMPKKHTCIKILIAVLAITLLSVASIFVISKLLNDHAEPEQSDKHSHSWNDATCLSAKICSSCGETKGRALGHNWMDATCTQPRTCSVCRQTEGMPLEHNWLSATCTQPCICTVCAAEKGDAIGHQWTEATKNSPKTCQICDATSGSAAKHGLFSCTILKDSNEYGSTADVSIGSWISADGKTHTNAAKFWVVNKPGYSNTEYVLLDLNEEYETMLVSLCIGSGSAKGANAYIRIYLDGELSALSPTTSDLETNTMTLDVSGVNQVRIECITESPNSTYCIVDAWLSIP